MTIMRDLGRKVRKRHFEYCRFLKASIQEIAAKENDSEKQEGPRTERQREIAGRVIAGIFRGHNTRPREMIGTSATVTIVRQRLCFYDAPIAIRDYIHQLASSRELAGSL